MNPPPLLSTPTTTMWHRYTKSVTFTYFLTSKNVTTLQSLWWIDGIVAWISIHRVSSGFHYSSTPRIYQFFYSLLNLLLCQHCLRCFCLRCFCPMPSFPIIVTTFRWVTCLLLFVFLISSFRRSGEPFRSCCYTFLCQLFLLDGNAKPFRSCCFHFFKCQNFLRQFIYSCRCTCYAILLLLLRGNSKHRFYILYCLRCCNNPSTLWLIICTFIFFKWKRHALLSSLRFNIA